jgi:glycosyltransferase involved in cell wall biosynthesis
MAWWYCRGDLLVFPSTMDTFGMTVVEAQACGCPALVTDVGGPQEIVAAGWTGFALSLEDRDRWLDRIALFIRYKARHPQGYLDMRRRISEAILERYSLNGSLNDIIGYRAEKALQEGRVRPTLRPAMAVTARAVRCLDQ